MLNDTSEAGGFYNLVYLYFCYLKTLVELIVKNEVICAGSVVKEPRDGDENNPVPVSRSSKINRL